MTRRLVILIALVLLPLASTAAQSKDGWRLSVSAGPSAAISNGRWVPQSGGTPYSFTLDKPVISGAESGQFNLGVALTRRVPESALSLRIEWMYNRAESSPHPYAWGPEMPWTPIPVRPALLDEFHSIGSGFTWDAYPNREISPYLITTTGMLFSRIGWNPDSSSSVVSDTYTSRALFATAGIGIRVPFRSRELFVEWRRFFTTVNTVGSTAAPVSFGFRF